MDLAKSYKFLGGLIMEFIKMYKKWIVIAIFAGIVGVGYFAKADELSNGSWMGVNGGVRTIVDTEIVVTDNLSEYVKYTVDTVKSDAHNTVKTHVFYVNMNDSFAEGVNLNSINGKSLNTNKPFISWLMGKANVYFN